MGKWEICRMIVLDTHTMSDDRAICFNDITTHSSKDVAMATAAQEKSMLTDALKSQYSRASSEEDIIQIGDTILNVRSIIAVNYELREKYVVNEGKDHSDDNNKEDSTD